MTMTILQAINFPPPPLQVPGAVKVQVSCRVYVSGVATITGGLNAQVSFNGEDWGSSVVVASGGMLYARSDAPGTYNSSVVPVVSVGAQAQASFPVSTCNVPSYIFSDVINQPPGISGSTSSQSTGCNLGGDFTFASSRGTLQKSSPNPVGPFGQFVVGYVGTKAWGATDTITVKLNGYESSFTVKTPLAPPSYVWSSPQIIVKTRGSAPQINTVKIGNLVCAATISASGSGSPGVSRDGENWSTSLVLTAADNGRTISVKVMTPAIAGQSNTGVFDLVVGAMNVALGALKVTAM
jgi:hypothetical protein